MDDLPCERLIIYPIARIFADARVQRIYGNEIMREVIARNL